MLLWQELELLVEKMKKNLKNQARPILKELEQQIPISSELIEKYNQKIQRTFKITFNVRTQRQFNLVRALALLSDIKIVEETNWLFDEMFQKVWPGDIPELEPYKGYVKDDLDTLLGDILPYDLFYYYSNQYVSRYVNNWYNYEKYDPKLFKKNIERAIDNYCNTQKEKAIEYSRAEVVSLTELLKGKKFKVFRNGTEGNLTVKYIWRTSSSDACKHCIKMDGKEFSSEKMIRTHWHCRCKIEKITKIVSDNGEILHSSKKLL